MILAAKIILFNFRLVSCWNKIISDRAAAVGQLS